MKYLSKPSHPHPGVGRWKQRKSRLRSLPTLRNGADVCVNIVLAARRPAVPATAAADETQAVAGCRRSRAETSAGLAARCLINCVVLTDGHGRPTQ